MGTYNYVHGAAAAASVILGFDVSTTASALGLAGTQSAGLWAFNADGAMSKRLAAYADTAVCDENVPQRWVRVLLSESEEP